MRAFCVAVLLYCAVRGILELFFSKKENAALLSGLRFVLSLGLILLFLLPLASLWKHGDQISFFPEDTTKTPPLLQERFSETLTEDLQAKFPEETIALAVVWNDDGTPDKISVQCKHKEAERKIADYLLLRYQLRSENESEEEQ